MDSRSCSLHICDNLGRVTINMVTIMYTITQVCSDLSECRGMVSLVCADLDIVPQYATCEASTIYCGVKESVCEGMCQGEGGGASSLVARPGLDL